MNVEESVGELVGSAIGLSHLGESLVAEMMRSPKVREVCGLPEDFSVVSIECPLVPSGPGYRCDGMHRVDVVATRDGATDAMAVEVKLGDSSTYLSPSSFDSKPVERSAHADGRLKGSMIAFLSGGMASVPEAGRPMVKMGADDLREIRPEWRLVVRESVKQRLAKQSIAALENAEIIGFEDLVRAYGGKEPFNALVERLVGNDPWSAWGLGEATSKRSQ